MRINGVQSATYMIYAYRFVSTNRTNYKGFDNGKGRQLPRTLADDEVKTRCNRDGMRAILDKGVSHTSTRQVLLPQRICV